MLHHELIERNLPALLQFQDSTPVCSATAWSDRRKEILALLQHEFLGTIPTNICASFSLIDEDKDAYGGKATHQTIRVDLTKENRSFSFSFQLVVPNNIEKPVPVFVQLQFVPVIAAGLGEEIIDNGFAIAHILYTDLAPDDSKPCFEGLCGFSSDTSSSRWGKIGVWAFGASKVVDYLMTDSRIDPTRIGVIGHSRLGLTALWCGAIDERFSCIAGINTGNLYRGSEAETFLDLSRDYTRYWFCEKMFQGRTDANELPFDLHFLLALAAPRHLYLTGATRDLWTSAHSQILASVAASDVYSLFGLEGLTDAASIQPDIPSQNGHIGFFLRTGTHYLGRDDWHAVMDYRKLHHI